MIEELADKESKKWIYIYKYKWDLSISDTEAKDFTQSWVASLRYKMDEK